MRKILGVLWLFPITCLAQSSDIKGMAKLVQPYQIAIPKKLVKKIGFKSENKNDKADILSIKVEPTVFPNIYFETVMQEKGKIQVYSFGGIGLIYLSNINAQLFGHNKLKYGPVFDYYQSILWNKFDVGTRWVYAYQRKNQVGIDNFHTEIYDNSYRDCMVTDKIKGTVLHQNISGAAFKMLCQTRTNAVVNSNEIIYLEDYQYFINSANYMEYQVDGEQYRIDSFRLVINEFED